MPDDDATEAADYGCPRVAVAALCRNHKGDILLAQRAHGAEPGHWELPGGKLEEGEDLKAAALRELQEETGIIAGSPKIIGAVNDIQEAGYHWVTIIVACRHLAGKPTIQEPNKCSALDWFDLRSLPEPLRQSIPLLLQEFGSEVVKAVGKPLI